MDSYRYLYRVKPRASKANSTLTFYYFLTKTLKNQPKFIKYTLGNTRKLVSKAVEAEFNMLLRTSFIKPKH